MLLQRSEGAKNILTIPRLPSAPNRLKAPHVLKDKQPGKMRGKFTADGGIDQSADI
jgi:hypothetical protein